MTPFERAYPADLRVCEGEKVETRRDKARVRGRRSKDGSLPPDCVGFALSGGGIRSATFCLGVFQELSRIPWRGKAAGSKGGGTPVESLLRRIDFTSTVSGGGYFGGFLGRLFTRQEARDPGPGSADAVEKVETTLASPDSESNRWLRENGRYLSPNGAGDAILAGAAYLRNLVALHVVLGTFMLALFLGLNLARVGPAWLIRRLGVADASMIAPLLWWSPWVVVPVAFLAVLGVPFGLAYWLTQRQTSRSLAAAPAAVAFGGLVAGIWAVGTPSARGSTAMPVAMILSGLLVFAPFFAALRHPGPKGVPLRTPPTFLTTGVLGGIGVAALVVAWLCARAEASALAHYSSVLLYLTFAVAAGLVSWAVAMPADSDGPETIRKARRRLSAALKWTLILIAGSAGAAFVDSLGQTIYATAAADGFVKTLTHPLLLPPVAALLALVAGAQKLSLLLGKLMPAGRLKVRWELVASGAAALLLLAYLTVLSALAHGFLWNWKTPKGDPAGRLALASGTSTGKPAPPDARTGTTWVGRAGVLVANGEGASRLTLTRDELTVKSSSDAPRTPRCLANPVGEKSRMICFLALLTLAMATGLFGRTFSFVNLSSHHALYSARLIRAFLGASNPDRIGGGDGASVTEVIPCDDVMLAEYAPESRGGPLHLVNVTINETVSGRSNIERRDRKGLQMAIGPAGISVGVKHHALWVARAPRSPFFDLLMGRVARFVAGLRPGSETAASPTPTVSQATQPLTGAPRDVQAIPNGGFNVLGGESAVHGVEDFTLGSWLGVSGAAFTTGLGSRTSLGLSLLLGLTNVRIGRWWDSGVSPRERRPAATSPAEKRRSTPECRPPKPDDGKRRRGPRAWRHLFGAALPVQECLLDELLARFHGPHRRHWYLSDGGHFENTGCYELIRRRVPIIVCCDCGADPTYQFADIANLVRKARTDFDAEIEFLRVPSRVAGEESDHDTATESGKQPLFLERIGPLHLLRPTKPTNPGGPNRASEHCALATVTYHDGADRKPSVGSLILFLKPTLKGDESEDVLHYAGAHDAFPHESTADQFFDEAQWESYRKLGEHTAHRVFDEEGVTFEDLFARLKELRAGTPGGEGDTKK